MAATKNNRSHPDDPLFRKTRELIQTTQLVKRMNANSLGTLKNDVTGELTEMTPSQLRSCEILMARALPALQATTIMGPDGEAITPVLNVKGKE